MKNFESLPEVTPESSAVSVAEASDYEPAEKQLDDLKRVGVILENKNRLPANNNAAEAAKMVTDLENFADYKKYRQQKITFDSIKRLVDDLANKARLKSDSETFLRNKIANAENHAEAYYQLIGQMSNLHNPQVRFRLGDNFGPEMERLNIERRQRHNLLLASLRELRERLVKESGRANVDIDLYDKFFKPEEMRDYNRHIVGEWAYTNVQGEKIQSLINHFKEKVASSPKEKLATDRTDRKSKRRLAE